MSLAAAIAARRARSESPSTSEDARELVDSYRRVPAPAEAAAPAAVESILEGSGSMAPGAGDPPPAPLPPGGLVCQCGVVVLGIPGRTGVTVDLQTVEIVRWHDAQRAGADLGVEDHERVEGYAGSTIVGGLRVAASSLLPRVRIRTVHRCAWTGEAPEPPRPPRDP